MFLLLALSHIRKHGFLKLSSNIIICLQYARSTFDNLDSLKDGLPGALVTALVLGAHEISHILVARSSGIKLGLPYFVPSWQVRYMGSCLIIYGSWFILNLFNGYHINEQFFLFSFFLNEKIRVENSFFTSIVFIKLRL